MSLKKKRERENTYLVSTCNRQVEKEGNFQWSVLQLESVLKKIAVLEPVCKRLTYISKNMIWAVASSFSINLTHILES